jgi:hypothetical protein
MDGRRRWSRGRRAQNPAYRPARPPPSWSWCCSWPLSWAFVRRCWSTAAQLVLGDLGIAGVQVGHDGVDHLPGVRQRGADAVDERGVGHLAVLCGGQQVGGDGEGQPAMRLGWCRCRRILPSVQRTGQRFALLSGSLNSRPDRATNVPDIPQCCLQIRYRPAARRQERGLPYDPVAR